MARIAVIGAGIAGLSAAKHLEARGHAVVVFEKARGVSGRCATRRHESGAFDHGAQYFTARTPEFRSQVADWERRGAARRWNASIVSLETGASTPVGSETARYVGTPGMNALGKDLGKELEVRCETRILALAGEPGAIELDAEGKPVEEAFEAVVVATPAEQSVPLLRLAPALAAHAGSTAMQPCLALMVTWREAVGVDFDAAFVADSPLAWIARNAAKPDRGDGECWVLHASPEWSQVHLEEDPERSTSLLLEAFHVAIGRRLPRPEHTAMHRWRFARTAEPAKAQRVWDDRARIGVCGDWTHGDRVEGAWHSGLRLAREMSESL